MMDCKMEKECERELITKKYVAIAANSFSCKKDECSVGEGGNIVARIQ